MQYVITTKMQSLVQTVSQRKNGFSKNACDSNKRLMRLHKLNAVLLTLNGGGSVRGKVILTIRFRTSSTCAMSRLI